jgi:hypothetical protein
MKKILAAALLCCAVSSFATWDYFPVKPAGKGEVKVGIGYDVMNSGGFKDANMLALAAGARFSVIEGLEIATMWGFPLSYSVDGTSCSDILGDDNCPPSWVQPTVGVRYWLPMGLGIALDVDLPFQGDAMGEPNLGFTPAVQFSTNFNDQLSLGSEVNFYIPLENDDKYTPEGVLGIGAELDYSLGMVTPYFAVGAGIPVLKAQFAGVEAPETSDAIVDIGLGAIIGINEMFGATVDVLLGVAGYDEMPLTIGATFSLNF